MNNISAIEISNNTYVYFKEQELNNNIYKIYLDMKTRTKVKIFDANSNLVTNKNIINNIIKEAFFYSNQYEQDSTDFDEMLWKEFGYIIEEKYYPGGKERFSEQEETALLLKLKYMFYEKFGNIIPEKKLNEIIKSKIKGIYKVEEIDNDSTNYSTSTGVYDTRTQEIIICKKYNYTEQLNILFHEFIHAVVKSGGAAVKLDSNEYLLDGMSEDDSSIYEYGDIIDEGIVSYIENMKKSNKWQKFKNIGSYDCSRRIISHLIMIYDNSSSKKGDSNFIEEYIINPKETLARIYNIFLDYYTNTRKNLNYKEVQILATQKYLDFISKIDNIENITKEEEPYKLKECEDILSNIFIYQISNKKVDTKEDLKNVILEIKCYMENLSQPNSSVNKLINQKIKDFAKIHPNIEINYDNKKYKNGNIINITTSNTINITTKNFINNIIFSGEEL